jgi:thioredoxin 1
MQRILADMMRNVPAARSYVKMMYIGRVSNGTITSMHGVEEAQENARQICIREEQPEKYWDYISCYMKEGEAEDCLGSESIDQAKLTSCLEDPGRGLAYAQRDFDMVEKNRITGSPTLIMNGNMVKESDFATSTTSSRSAEALKELLCCGFKSQPAFCSLQLNRTRAETMFCAGARPTTQVRPSAPAAQAQPAQIPLARLGEKNPRQPMLVTEETLSSAVDQYPLLVVEGYATWCGYSQMMNATLAELAGDLQGQVAFGLIDAEKNSQTKAKYNISAYPTTLIFKDGKLMDTVVGDQQKSSFLARLKKIDPVLDTSALSDEDDLISVKATPSEEFDSFIQKKGGLLSSR